MKSNFTKKKKQKFMKKNWEHFTNRRSSRFSSPICYWDTMDGHYVQVTRRRGLHLIRSAIRSGMRRYPRELFESLRQGMQKAKPPNTSLQTIEDHSFAAAWLGHASVLTRLGKINLLVDPVFSSRIGKRMGRITLGPKRIREAPVATQGLPTIHLILLTHAHFDHLDKPTLRKLANENTLVITAPGTRRLIPRGFGAVIELPAYREMIIHGLKIRAYSPLHWGSRNVIDQHRKCNSYLVESNFGRIFFTGDSAYTQRFRTISDVDLAVFGIGSYNPWEHMHSTPEQTWAMFRSMNAKHLLPIHHSTFRLSDEPMDEPLQRLRAVGSQELDKIVLAEQGEIWVGADDSIIQVSN